MINKSQARALKSVCGLRREQMQLNRQGNMAHGENFAFV